MNLPNLVTFSRIIFLVLIVFLVYQRWIGAAFLAFMLALAAAISDWLDGYLARKFNQISNFGKLMDAIIDKVMVLGLFLLLLILGIMPVWTIPLLVLIVLRELGITLLRMIAAKKGVVLAAEKTGKRKMIWQTTSICVLLFLPVISQDLATLTGLNLQLFYDWIYLNGMIYFIYSTWLALYSGVFYIGKYMPAVIGKRINSGLGLFF